MFSPSFNSLTENKENLHGSNKRIKSAFPRVTPSSFASPNYAVTPSDSFRRRPFGEIDLNSGTLKENHEATPLHHREEQEQEEENHHGAVPQSLTFEITKTPEIQRVIQTNDGDEEDEEDSLNEAEVLGISQPSPQTRLSEDMLHSPNPPHEMDMQHQVAASPDMMKDVSPIESRMEESQATDEFPVFRVETNNITRESFESNQSDQTRESIASVKSPGDDNVSPASQSMLRRQLFSDASAQVSDLQPDIQEDYHSQIEGLHNEYRLQMEELQRTIHFQQSKIRELEVTLINEEEDKKQYVTEYNRIQERCKAFHSAFANKSERVQYLSTQYDQLKMFHSKLIEEKNHLDARVKELEGELANSKQKTVSSESLEKHVVSQQNIISQMEEMMNQLDTKNNALEAQVKGLLEKLSESENSYKQEISALKKVQSESFSDSSDKTGDTGNLLKEIKRLKQEYDELAEFSKEESAIKDEYIQQLEERLKTLENHLIETNLNLETAKTEHSEQVKNYQSKMDVLSKEIETLKGKEGDFSGIFSEISGLNVQLMAKCDQQVATINKLQLELREINEKFTMKSQESEKYQEKIANLEGHSKHLNEEIESLRSDVVKRSEDTKILEEKIEGLLKSHATQLDELQKSANDQRESFEISLESSKKEKEELQNLNERQNSEKQALLKQELEICQRKLDEISESRDQLVLIEKNLSSELESARSSTEQIKSENKKLIEQMNELQSKLEETNMALELHKKEFGGKAEVTSMEMKVHKVQNLQLKSKLVETTQKLEGALAAIQGHQQETVRLQKLLEESKSKVTYLETTILEAGEKAIQALQLELEEAKISLEISNNEKQYLELQIEALLLECDSSNPYSTSKLLSTKFKLEKEMQQLSGELYRCQNFIIQQKESANQRIALLKANLEKAQKEVKQLENTLSQLRALVSENRHQFSSQIQENLFKILSSN